MPHQKLVGAAGANKYTIARLSAREKTGLNTKRHARSHRLRSPRPRKAQRRSVREKRRKKRRKLTLVGASSQRITRHLWNQPKKKTL